MLPGDKFERYTIETVLGSGGMGRVYKAHDPKLGRDVAVKVLLPADAAAGSTGPTEEAKARIVREARAAAALTHPNAVAIYDVGESESAGPYIVMELVVGQSLRDMIQRKDTPIEDKVRWLKETASALAAAHDRGIVHRDVKPENVLVRTDGVAKVVDFGIARRAAGAADPSAPTEASLPTLTELGVQIGTPVYMAPEQIKGDPVDGRSDQFAWGVVAYELFAGKLPWRIDKGPLGVAASILTDTPPTLDDVPPEIRRVITRALSKDPADRFGSMRDVIAAFDAPSIDEPTSTSSRVSTTPKSARTDEPKAARSSQSPKAQATPDPRRYDTEQFKEIFQRALERQEAEGRYQHEDLVAAAREMGIRDDVLERTVADTELAASRDTANADAEAEERRRGLRRFGRLAITLAFVNFMLVFVAHIWNRWMIFGSLIGLAFQLRNVYFPRDRPFGVSRREKRRERREERRARRTSSSGASSRDSDARIEEGVRILLSTTQKRAGRVRVASAPAAERARDAKAEEEAVAEDESDQQKRERR